MTASLTGSQPMRPPRSERQTWGEPAKPQMDLAGSIHWLLLTIKRRIGHGTLSVPCKIHTRAAQNATPKV
jgi:hypothetical protein